MLCFEHFILNAMTWKPVGFLTPSLKTGNGRNEQTDYENHDYGHEHGYSWG